MNVRSITTQPDWGNSPARTRRKTGEVFLNERYLQRKDLSADNWNMYLLHEEGHIVLDTRDEFSADAYALKKYLPSGRSLKAGVQSLTKVLDKNNPVHLQRIMNALQTAAQFDCETNKKCNALSALNGTNMNDIETSYDRSLQEALHMQGVAQQRTASVTDMFDNVTGNATEVCGQRPTPRKCSGGPFKRKRCEETNRHEQSTWQKCIETESQRATTAQGLTNQATQVKQETAAQTQILKTQLNAEQVMEQEETKRQAQSKTPLIIGIAVVAGAVMLAVFFLTKKPKP